MKVAIEYSTGNFTLAIVGNVDTQGIAAKPPLSGVIESGIRYVTERDVASACYKAIAGKGGKLPKGFKRDTLAFGEAAAESFREVATTELSKLMPDVSVEVTENVGTAKADAIALMSQHESANDLESWLAARGYDGDTHGEDGEFHPAAVNAIAQRVKKVMDAHKAEQKAKLAGI
jgi:hypothetical protein